MAAWNTQEKKHCQLWYCKCGICGDRKWVFEYKKHCSLAACADAHNPIGISDIRLMWKSNFIHERRFWFSSARCRRIYTFWSKSYKSYIRDARFYVRACFDKVLMKILNGKSEPRVCVWQMEKQSSIKCICLLSCKSDSVKWKTKTHSRSSVVICAKWMRNGCNNFADLRICLPFMLC